MIRGPIGSGGIREDRSWRTVLPSSALMLAGVIALLAGGVVIALLLGERLGTLGLYAGVAIISAIFMAIVIALRQDELAVTLVIAVQLYVDFYVGLHIISQVMALALLVIFFLARSPRHPWVEPRAIWLWVLFLVLAVYPAIQGATDPYETAFYYPNIFFGALTMFWLGTVIARESACVRRLFKMLAFFGTLIAVHTIIQATTGTFLFATTHYNAFLQRTLNYQISGDIVTHRVASFFVDPNWDGTFFAIILFIALGLFAESSSFLEKALYLAEMSLMLPALLFTYSNGAWIGTFAGVITFFLFMGRARYRVLLPFIILIAVLLILAFFPAQVGLQFQRAADPAESSLRVAIWQTAIRVISAYPLTGVGLSHDLYGKVSNLYRVPSQYVLEDHPHNSYLEFGALAGLPVLLVFMALLAFTLWLAFRNWALADVRTRSLIGAGIASAIALSVNSVSINGWTLPPLAAIGWLILGAITSPLLSRGLKRQVTKERNT